MSEKVLLVDDEEDFLDVMAERMRSRGIEVSTTTSATHALEMVEENSFDAIVMDLMMPELEGTEALKAIKNKNDDSCQENGKNKCENSCQLEGAFFFL